MRDIDTLVIHCSDTPTGRVTTTADIDSWHVERGFKRADSYRQAFNPTLKAIGYHFVIYVDGSVHTGRQVAEVGAHCQGSNSSSIGICLVGKGKFTSSQWKALYNLVTNLELTYGNQMSMVKKLRVVGHNQTSSGIKQGKSCPNFDVAEWRHNNMVPFLVHVAE